MTLVNMVKTEVTVEPPGRYQAVRRNESSSRRSPCSGPKVGQATYCAVCRIDARNLWKLVSGRIDRDKWIRIP